MGSSAPAETHSHEEQKESDLPAIIRQRIGKDKLSQSSLRGVGVAELREVADEVGIADHLSLKKANLIQALLNIAESTPSADIDCGNEQCPVQAPEPGRMDSRLDQPEQDRAYRPEAGTENDQQGGDMHESLATSDDALEVMTDNQDCSADQKCQAIQKVLQGVAFSARPSLNECASEDSQVANFTDNNGQVVVVPAEIVIDDDEEEEQQAEVAEAQIEDSDHVQSNGKGGEEKEGTGEGQEDDEDEEYDEDPYLEEELSENRDEDVADDDKQPNHEEDEEQAAATDADAEGDGRHPTSSHGDPEEDQRQSERQGNKAASGEHEAHPGETQEQARLSGSESGRGPSERRRSGTQAPIVWQPTDRRCTLFDHHQRMLDAHEAEPQDFGGAVQPYNGRKLVVSIPAEYASGLRRPARGKPKRQVQFSAGQFQLEGCAELPCQEEKKPLQLSNSSISMKPPKWNRRVKLTAKLQPDEKVEYSRHGDCITVRLLSLPTKFWYSPTIEQRFVIDPAEYDSDYRKGVARVEKGIAARPEAWKEGWINKNISRVARAKALRTFLGSNNHVKPAAYYHHFVSLCKGIQKLHPAISKDESEKAYERGCARTVGCASTETFKILTALPKDDIGDIMRALGMELCTPEFISGTQGVDERLLTLIKTHCPPHLFWKVICCKGGSGPEQRSVAALAPPPDQIDIARPGRQPESQRPPRQADDPAHAENQVRRMQNALPSGHVADRWARDPGRSPDRDAREHHRTDTVAATKKPASRWSERDPVRGGVRDRSRPRSPAPLLLGPRDLDRGVDSRGRGQPNRHQPVTYPERRMNGRADWSRGAQDTAAMPHERKGWENLSGHDRAPRQGGMLGTRRGQREAAQDFSRWDGSSPAAQKFPERVRKLPAYQSEVEREARQTQVVPPGPPGSRSQGGFVYPQDNCHSAVPARRDVQMHVGYTHDDGRMGAVRAKAAARPRRAPLESMHGPELGRMQRRVSASDAYNPSPPYADINDDLQGLSVHRKPGMLQQRKRGDVYGHDPPPSSTRKRNVIHVDDDLLQQPASMDSRSLAYERARMPDHTLLPSASPPTYGAVQSHAPPAQAYDAEHFQAAVTQAVQEVVKRLGVSVPAAIPDAAAAAAVQNVRTPHAEEHLLPAPGARLLSGGGPEQQYGARAGMAHGRAAHVHDNQHVDDRGPISRNTNRTNPAPQFGKRPRDVLDDDVSPVNARYDMDSKGSKARRGDLPYKSEQQHRARYPVSREQPTRYPDVEIVPDVGMDSRRRDDYYAEQPGFPRDHPQWGAVRRIGHQQPQHGARRGHSNEPQPRGALGLPPQHDDGHADPGTWEGHGMGRPQSASVGGFLNDRSRPVNDARGVMKPEGRHTQVSPARAARTAHHVSPSMAHADHGTNASRDRPSRWAPAGEQHVGGHQLPPPSEQQPMSNAHVRSGAPEQQPSKRMQQDDLEQQVGRREQEPAQQRVQHPGQQHTSDSGWDYAREQGTNTLGNNSDVRMNAAAPAAHDMYIDSVATGVHAQQCAMSNGRNQVAHVHDGMLHQAPEPPRMGANKAVAAPVMYASASGAVRGKPATKLRSGGSRVASSARTAEGGDARTVENEDAFAVGSCCFAVGDGLEQVEPSGAVINSGAFAHELVSSAVTAAAESVQEYVHGRRSTPVEPKAVLQQALSSVKARGAAAVMLGSLDPLSSMLSVSKMGDVGFLVLRPGPSLSTTGDLEVISGWMPYDPRDHPSNDFSQSYYVAPRNMRGQGTWSRDCHTDTVHLQPSDIIVAGSDGLWDAVHFFGHAGLATRQLIRSLYLGEQLDPGQLAERLLLRAWGAVQESRANRIVEQVPPFMEQVYRSRQGHAFTIMPEDDIAVVVSYVLQA